MPILNLGLGTVFFAVGLILALSKSAKGSAVVTCLLGIVGGGGSGVAIAGFHSGATQADATSLPQNPEVIGWLLFSIGIGTVLGLAVGLMVKFLGKGRGFDPGIGKLGPPLDKATEIKTPPPQ